MSILGERFFKTRNAIYSYGLGCRELAVYSYLRSRVGSKDTCWPSMQTIANACNCSDTTAHKAVDELEHIGFIRKVPTYATDRKGRRQQCNNTYYILPMPPPDRRPITRKTRTLGRRAERRKKQDKGPASRAAPGQPQTPAVRAFPET